MGGRRTVAEPSPRPPSVERVLAAVRAAGPDPREHDALLEMTRHVVDDERRRLAAGQPPRAIDALARSVLDRLGAWVASPVTRTLNATGVIVHTNLGRAPWPDEAIEAATASSASLLLEIDPATGRRGARFRLAEDHLVALTGAEDALVTNNNAAAVALAVGLVGRGRGVAVSRGELVEIGGGVRIPEIVRSAGARLVEVGTTNRTRAADFGAALADGKARAVLRVHPSNFAQTGFIERPDAKAVAALAHEHGAIVIDDLGSGALLPTERFGLAHEPTPRERLEDGADVVTFSGDKLVGGPQAGFVVGRADLVGRIRRSPLARAMRPDKVTLAAVAATLGLYRAGLAIERIPVWRMIAADRETLRGRADAVRTAIGDSRAEIIATQATVGGGSLPGETLASVGVALGGPHPDALATALRTGTPAVVARIDAGRVVLDLRTIAPEDDSALIAAIRSALGASGGAES